MPTGLHVRLACVVSFSMKRVALQVDAIRLGVALLSHILCPFGATSRPLSHQRYEALDNIDT